MKYEVYRNLAKITLSPRPKITSELYDVVHMSLGLSSEISEIIDAINNQDATNYGEELGDCWWYVAVCDYVLNTDIKHDEIAPINVSKKPPYENSQEAFYDGYIYYMSKIADLAKRSFAYGDDLDDKVKAEMRAYLIDAGKALAIMGWKWEINLNDVYTTNINKLLGRYDKEYSDFAAKNRDLENELAIIMEGLNKGK